ncbi:MAG: tail fiber domain-containing protein, partial [Actinomycetota bacterium]
PATQFLGTTDDKALNFRVNDARALRLEPDATSPNVIGGFADNAVTAGALGATIGGGGDSGNPNRVTDDYGVVAGGRNNRAGNDGGTTSDRSSATVGGGSGNTASGQVSTVGGGSANTASGFIATVAGGGGNIADGPVATVGGGTANAASGIDATVPGGNGNTAAGNFSLAAGRQAKANHNGAFVWADNTPADFASTADGEFAVRAGGGVRLVVGANTCQLDPGTGAWTGSCASASPSQAWLLGGNSGTNPDTQFLGTTDNQALNFRVNDARAFRLEPNPTSPNVIGGFSGNQVTAGVFGAVIGGGGASTLTNRVTDDYGTVGGGSNNQAGNDAGTTSNRSFATVGGGAFNTASGLLATVAGGESNTASGQHATVGGGDENTASGFRATVGGGGLNTASGSRATVGGGSGNTASGLTATVPGGSNNTAQGDLSFAAGNQAKANHAGSFVWADSTFADVASSASNQFTARTSGGARFFSNSTLTTGVTLAAGGGSWASVSDRAVKADLRPVSSGDILARVAELPITTWRYISQDGSIRHIGPTAQDFHATFGVGEDDRHITAVDADGVALAAIQGLNEKLDAEIVARREAPSGVSGTGGIPTAAWLALAAALGLLGQGLGRRWERRATARA